MPVQGHDLSAKYWPEIEPRLWSIAEADLECARAEIEMKIILVHDLYPEAFGTFNVPERVKMTGCGRSVTYTHIPRSYDYIANTIHNSEGDGLK